jgi:glycine cleavage system H protein
MQIIKGLKYSEDHEWVKIEGGRVFIGITDYAQNSLGSVVFVDLPDKGRKLMKGDVLGVIESVKAASDIYTPVSGTVAEVNIELADHPEKINETPYDSWIAVIEPFDPAELEGLMDADAYALII